MKNNRPRLFYEVPHTGLSRIFTLLNLIPCQSDIQRYHKSSYLAEQVMYWVSHVNRTGRTGSVPGLIFNIWPTLVSTPLRSSSLHMLYMLPWMNSRCQHKSAVFKFTLSHKGAKLLSNKCMCSLKLLHPNVFLLRLIQVNFPWHLKQCQGKPPRDTLWRVFFFFLVNWAKFRPPVGEAQPVLGRYHIFFIFLGFSFQNRL